MKGEFLSLQSFKPSAADVFTQQWRSHGWAPNLGLGFCRDSKCFMRVRVGVRGVDGLGKKPVSCRCIVCVVWCLVSLIRGVYLHGF